MSRTTLGAATLSAPHTVSPDEPLGLASKLMRWHRLDHLPVLAEGRVVGLLSQRDIETIATWGGVDATRLTAQKVMEPDPHICGSSTPLSRVTAEMARGDHRAVVVVDDEDKSRVLGVFTHVDALRALGRLLAPRAARRPKRANPSRRMA